MENSLQLHEILNQDFLIKYYQIRIENKVGKKLP